MPITVSGRHLRSRSSARERDARGPEPRLNVEVGGVEVREGTLDGAGITAQGLLCRSRAWRILVRRILDGRRSRVGERAGHLEWRLVGGR